jgi:hypothetical protein
MKMKLKFEAVAYKVEHQGTALVIRVENLSPERAKHAAELLQTEGALGRVNVSVTMSETN